MRHELFFLSIRNQFAHARKVMQKMGGARLVECTLPWKRSLFITWQVCWRSCLWLSVSSAANSSCGQCSWPRAESQSAFLAAPSKPTGPGSCHLISYLHTYQQLRVWVKTCQSGRSLANICGFQQCRLQSPAQRDTCSQETQALFVFCE